jgi:GNAT superfamily N-acetyltransferase
MRVLQLACLPHGRADLSLRVAGGGWVIPWTTTKRWPLASWNPPSSGCDTAYLSRAGVLPAWRGQGLQRRLIALRERLARRQGFVWMISDTTDNVPSSNNLIKAGYKLIEPSAPWANSESLYWSKKLVKA